MKWNHVGIKSADIAKSLHFYCDLLGLQRQETLELFGKTYYFVGDESASIEIEAGNAGDTQTNPRLQTGLYHLAFTVDDVRSLTTRLQAQGVTVVLEPLSTRPDRIVSFIEDPDGVFIQLIQILREEPGRN